MHLNIGSRRYNYAFGKEFSVTEYFVSLSLSSMVLAISGLSGWQGGPWGFPGGTAVKNLSANAGDTVDACWIPRLGRSPGGANGNPLQYSCLGNLMDRGAWQATVCGVARSQTWLSNGAFTHAKGTFQCKFSLDHKKRGIAWDSLKRNWNQIKVKDGK